MCLPEIPKNDPPLPPLERGHGRIYNIQVHVNNKKSTTGWPVLPQTNWCQIATDSIRFDDASNQQMRFTATEHFADSRQWILQAPQKDYVVHFSAWSYASILDNATASSIPWPESWEERIEKYLQPSRYIESNDAIFTSAVEENGDPRSVPIHIAAKVLIRHCLLNIQSDGQYSNTKNNTTTGLNVNGARSTVRRGKGSASDLVCVCVATLRAAGIPARPVVGMTNADTVGTVAIPPQYMVWGEYALPNAGWVPFVPKRMRGTVDGLSRFEPWQGLGTLPWLNRRVPLAFNFESYDIDRATQQLQMTFISSPQETQ
jgi:hypothetical protein